MAPVGIISRPPLRSISARSRNIAVHQGQSKTSRLEAYLNRTRPAAITEAESSEIARELAPVSEGYLRDLLRNCGVPLDALIEGVRQDSFEDLERTLGRLQVEYESGDAVVKRRCRNLVIQ